MRHSIALIALATTMAWHASALAEEPEPVEEPAREAEPPAVDAEQPADDAEQPPGGPDEATRSAARLLADEGGALFLAGDYPAAFEKLDKAYAVLAVPTIAYWSARCLEELGRWLEALERYEAATTLPIPAANAEVHQEAAQKAAEARQALLARMPRLVIVLEGPADAVVSIDGEALSSDAFAAASAQNPGTHRISAQHGKHEAAEDVQLTEGVETRVTLRLPMPPPDEPAPALAVAPVPTAPAPAPLESPESAKSLRTAGWVSLGVGAAGLLVGTISGLVVLSKYDDLDEQCPDQTCDASLQDDVDTLNALRPVSTIGLVVGGVAIATGMTLHFVASSEQEPTVGLFVSPNGMGARGRF